MPQVGSANQLTLLLPRQKLVILETVQVSKQTTAVTS